MNEQQQEPYAAVIVENSNDEGTDYNGGNGNDNNNDDPWDDLVPPNDATWPDAAPTPNGDCYLSVSCDGLGWAWTKYETALERFFPSVLWRYVS